MKYIADLHIHSRFSRATSKSLDLTALDLWAGYKGLQVVGTGDLTHPEWWSEIEERLVPAEEGFFQLKPEFSAGANGTRFVLSTEISSIYKKGGRVRKVHSLILFPGMESARRFSERLDRIGNLKSDGRPILGLDAKDLLAICLDISPDIFYIPAHIWTPWFSLLGSKSGFDSIDECFEDLTGHIHALETGLSSDPAMNWRLSSLDRYVLVSNSDAHSADKLGREANVFDTEMSYPGMIGALQRKGGFLGTLEFYPEEGKYHLDGCRNCGQSLEPDETIELGGRCPVCGKLVTVGVLARVNELADRPSGEKPDQAFPFHSLIPLTEVISEIVGVGPKSKKVMTQYHLLLQELGSELFILKEAPLEDVKKAGGELLAIALKRMRRNQVIVKGGYDGEYGRICLFESGEREKLMGQSALFGMAPVKKKKAPVRKKKAVRTEKEAEHVSEFQSSLLAHSDPLVDDLNPAQVSAVVHQAGPLSIVAGPGTGKTTVLTRRAAWLVREGLARSEEILGITFTRQAAGEMLTRMTQSLPFRAGLEKASIQTFHALGLRILSEESGPALKVLSEEEQLDAAKSAAKNSPFKPKELLTRITMAKQRLEGPEQVTDPVLSEVFTRYEAALAAREAVDFDDLVTRPVLMLQADPKRAARWSRRFPWMLVDEYQDINQAQYQMVRLLAPGKAPNLTVIGDPDQAIYGFRGADSTYFYRFHVDFPQSRIVRLNQNYRSTETILKASSQVISNNHGFKREKLVSGIKGPAKVTTAAMATPAAEAEYVVGKIEKLLGGTSHFALDSGRATGSPTAESGKELSLGDVAILYRLHDLAKPVADALTQAGIPFQQAGREETRETDPLDFKAEKINLLTMHAAKGLEFEIVFVIGLEEKILPYQPPQKEPAEIEEERRLFFVALTRARYRLFLTRSKTRTLYGKTGKPAPSPFLDEISKGLKAPDKLPDRKPRPKVRQLELF